MLGDFDQGYGITIHTGRRSDKPKALQLQNRWCYVLCGLFSGNARWRGQYLGGPAALLLPPNTGLLDIPAASNWETLHFDVVHVPRRQIGGGNQLTHVEPAPQPSPEVVWGCRPEVIIPEDAREAAFDTLRACGWLWWRGAASRLRANGRLAWWLAEYISRYMNDASPDKTNHDPWFAQVLQVAQAGLETGITVAGLASALGMGKESLRQGLQKIGEESPGHLLRRLRIERAKEALLAGGTIIEVARYCGYRSTSAMSDAFLRSTGLRPAAYVRSVRGASRSPNPSL